MRKEVEAEGELLGTLGAVFPDSSKTTLRQMIAQGRVRVNGDLARDAKRKLKRGDTLDIAGKESKILDSSLALLYEDQDLLVVIKPPGLLTVATLTERENTVQAYLNEYLGARAREDRVHVVHRLDRASSGVLVFAKTFHVREALKERFAAHDIDRIYVAIIEGEMPQERGTIRSWLGEDKALKVRSVAGAEQGKLAVTHYRTVAKGPRYSYLEVNLETGRRNQIRVHLSESGHPIIGDDQYGATADPIGRLGLHARLLGFVHPVSGQKLTFTAPVPEAFTNLKL